MFYNTDTAMLLQAIRTKANTVIDRLKYVVSLKLN